MDDDTGKGFPAAIALLAAVILALFNSVDAFVSPEQYNYAVDACKDSGGLQYYTAQRMCDSVCLRAINIHCTDGRIIERWPPKYTKTGE